jgi:hypothetical protein
LNKYFKYFCLFILLLIVISDTYSQIQEINKKISFKDSTKAVNIPSIGGIFISPVIGFEFPIPNLTNLAMNGFSFGARLEYASFKLHPVILGLVYQYQIHKGNEDFMTKNLLNTFDLKIHSVGLSVDFLLNKYLKSQFTIPFLTFEAKYLNFERTVSPEINIPGVEQKGSTFSLSAGGGFTLYIFDIYGLYTYSKDFPSAALKLKFHFPLIKF